jgi:hypothetical protein
MAHSFATIFALRRVSFETPRVPAFADAQCGANASHALMFRKKRGRIRGNFEQFS